VTSAANWGRIPAELRGLPQWVIAAPDKTPLSVDAHGQLYAASSVNPEQWLPFEVAAHHAQQRGYGVGFVLCDSDPYCCIDFDVRDAESQRKKGEPIDESKWTHPDQFNWIWEIAQNFDTYAETSQSGKGLHIWTRATLSKGYRRDNVEAYTSGRYIICTGNIALDRPIRERNEWVNAFASMYLTARERVDAIKLEEVEATITDEVLMERAWAADNALNFQALWRGEWQRLGYPSQSEADLALMSMFTFYSKSNEQCRRLFRKSALGQREKSQKNDRYLNLTLVTIRTRQANEDKSEVKGIDSSVRALGDMRRTQLTIAEPSPVPPPVAAALAAPASAASAIAGEQGLPWPPGFTRVLAQFIYDSAPRPVKEVAIVGALGLLAGLSAKAWHIPNSGLNIYMILVAQSAIGKEAMHSGVSALVKAASQRSPAIQMFVDFSDFASGPALIKACAANTCFVNVCGEWGHKLRRLAVDDGRDTSMSTLRRTMTDLYQKSGPSAIVGGITYSNKDSNIQSVSGVAYSMIGETTPKTFYTSLTESMMEDGFLSRFIIVEYTGERPALNRNQLREPPQVVSEYLGAMASTAQGKIGTNQSVPVSIAADAAQVMWAFEQECDTQINKTKDESWRQMWNRASLKVMRLSALLAVGDNFAHPCITLEHLEWALLVVRRDIGIMQRKLDEGDVGTDDTSRENKVVSIIRDYFLNGVPPGYKVPPAMRDNAIFPHSLIQKKCQRLPAFTAHKGGSTEATKQVMRSLVDNGYVMEVQKDKMVDAYGFHGKCYRILEAFPSNGG